MKIAPNGAVIQIASTAVVRIAYPYSSNSSMPFALASASTSPPIAA